MGRATFPPPISCAASWPLPWEEDCLLCGARAAGRCLCRACARGLPVPGPACPRCAHPLAAPDAPCGACQGRRLAFDAARACFAYRFPVDRLVQRFKYAGDLAVGRWLGERLAAALAPAAPGALPDAIVVPPLSRARLAGRGFNQALELAHPVARALGVRCDRHALVRLREARPQAALGRRARLANLRGAFGCTRRYDGRHVALVDDVLTTGATAHAIGCALRRAGAARVSVWVVARAPEPGR